MSGKDDISWKRVWHDGVVPQLSTVGLESLRNAIRDNDARLIQRATCGPLMYGIMDWPCEGACLIGFPALADGAVTKREVESRFGETCFAADQLLGELAAVRFLLNPYDAWTREEMRAAMLPEVELALAKRKGIVP